MEPRGEEQVSCVICFAGYEDGEDTTILTCNHQFHTSCIQQWIEQNATCPMCRAPIPIPQQDHRIDLDIDELLNDRFEIQIDENGDVWYFNIEDWFNFPIPEDDNEYVVIDRW